MQIPDLFKREISVGNVGQNIGFYMVLAVLLFIAYLQFKEANRQKEAILKVLRTIPIKVTKFIHFRDY